MDSDTENQENKRPNQAIPKQATNQDFIMPKPVSIPQASSRAFDYNDDDQFDDDDDDLFGFEEPAPAVVSKGVANSTVCTQEGSET